MGGGKSSQEAYEPQQPGGYGTSAVIRYYGDNPRAYPNKQMMGDELKILVEALRRLVPASELALPPSELPPERKRPGYLSSEESQQKAF
jgi:hypothetical protein